MATKNFAGAILLASLSLCVAAAPPAATGAKKPYHVPAHAKKSKTAKKDHRVAKVVKTTIRHSSKATSVARTRPAHAGTATASLGANRANLSGASRLTADFRQQKGRLSWPLSGTVSMPFGPQEYIKGVIHNNQGATIDCAEGTVVKAVYAGEVTAVMDIDGAWCVILKHGSYYTAYSNLASTNVSQGDQVGTGESLGRIGEAAQLEFMLSDGDGRFYDPEVWLKK